MTTAMATGTTATATAATTPGSPPRGPSRATARPSPAPMPRRRPPLAETATIDHATDHHGGELKPGDHGWTYTGLSNEKLAMWLFLGTECLLFGGLISTYLLYKSRVPEGAGPAPHDLYDIPFTSVSSFVLLMSSLT